MAKKKAANRTKGLKGLITKDKPMGPRIKKWAAEFEAKRRELRKLEPGGDAFNKVVWRLYDLHGHLHSFCELGALDHDIAGLVVPSLPEKADQLERLVNTKGRTLSLRMKCWITKSGWKPTLYTHIHPDCSSVNGITSETLPSQVAAILRKEAKALNAMANKIERRSSRQARRVSA